MKNKYNFQKKDAESFDFLQKIIIIGDSGVGKSNMFMKYSSGKFAENHMATIGVSSMFKIIKVEQANIKLQIWDTAGQDRFKAITKSYYRNTQGVLVVFGVDCRDSFYSVQKWIEDLTETTSEKTCLMLVGNKTDLEVRRAVSIEEASNLANTHGIEYMECSAKSGQNIEEIFEKLAKAMKKQFIDSYEPPKEKEKDDRLRIKTYFNRESCCEK